MQGRNFLKNNKYLFLVTLGYFMLGLVNIHFALLGLVCMSIPVIMLFKTRRKTWCQGYCPRAALYTKTGKLAKNVGWKIPRLFTTGPLKWVVLAYFGFSLLVILMSTLSVARGNPPMDHLRFLIIIPLGRPPQLFTIQSPAWLLHLSYRFYSMMMTTTLLGLVLSLVYKPRTWCTVCPIATLSDSYLKTAKK